MTWIPKSFRLPEVTFTTKTVKLLNTMAVELPWAQTLLSLFNRAYGERNGVSLEWIATTGPSCRPSSPR